MKHHPSPCLVARRLLPCVAALALVVAPFSRAEIFEWDPDGVAPSGEGGSGTWDTTSLFWYDVVNGTNASWVGGVADTAVFDYVSGTVDLAGSTQSVNGLSFVVDGFLLTNGTLTLAGTAPSVYTESAAAAVLAVTLGGSAGLIKGGDGDLYIDVPTAYTGTTTVSNNGRLFLRNSALLPTNNALVFRGDSLVDLGGGNQTLSDVTVPVGSSIADVAAAGVTRTGRLTNGTLSFVGAGDLKISSLASNSLSVLDASGLSSFTLVRSNNALVVQGGIYNSAIQGGRLALADTNTIVVNALTIGSETSNSDTPSLGELLLGRTNVIYANFFNISKTARSRGTIRFRDDLSNAAPTVVIRGRAGGDSRVGTNFVSEMWGGSVGNVSTGTLDFAVGYVDARFHLMELGRQSVVQGSRGTGRFAMGTNGGWVDINILSLGVGFNTSRGTAVGLFEQGGGTVVASNVIMGVNYSPNTNGFMEVNLVARYVLSNGTLRAATIAPAGFGQFGGGSARTLDFQAGTLRPYSDTSDLFISGSNYTLAVTTNVSPALVTNKAYTAGVTLNLLTNAGGERVFFTPSNQFITVFTNATIAGAGSLRKEGAGTLRILAGTSFSGETRIIEGTLVHGHTNALLNSPLNRTNADAGVWVVPAPLTGATVGGLYGTRDLAATNTAGTLITLGLATVPGTSFDYPASIRSGQLTKFGAGTQTLSGTNNIGTLRVERGTVNMTGVTNFINGGVTVGTDNTAANVAVLNWSSTAVVTGNGSRIGDGNQGSATQLMNIVSGYILFTNNAANAQFSVGPKQIGVLNVTGGSMEFAPDFDLFHVGGNSISFSDYRATGVVNVTGSGVLTYRGPSGFVVGAGVSNLGGATGFVSLASGGTLETAAPLTNGWGYGTVWLHGGTLRALGNIGNLMSMNRGAFLSTNGVILDSGVFTVGLDQALADGTGGGSLVKTGAGTLRLNGANTFPGDTVVAGGTLGGTGSVAGTVRVASGASIAPGTSAGTFTAAGALVMSNGSAYAWEHDGTNSDLVVAGSAVFDTAWTLNVTGTPAAGVYTLVSTTGGVTNFVVPTVVGSGGVVSQSGNNVILTITGASLTPFQVWQTNYFGATNNPAAAYDADPDSDGANNLLEYAFGSNPTLGGSVTLPATGTSGDLLTITVPRNSNATDISYVVQGAGDLLVWTNLATLSATNPAPAGSTVTYTNGTPISSVPAQFLRVKITQP